MNINEGVGGLSVGVCLYGDQLFVIFQTTFICEFVSAWESSNSLTSVGEISSASTCAIAVRESCGNKC